MILQEKFSINTFLEAEESKLVNDKLIDFIHSGNIGILILINFIKAKDWPYSRKKLSNLPIKNILLLWGLFYSEDGININLDYEIHPMKCFPNLYINHNKNHSKYPTYIDKNSKGTLSGCLRNSVNINNRRYEVKAAEYCSIFGIPDDCYDDSYENRMIKLLKNKDNLEIWCFEKNDYTDTNLDPYIKINYMKGEFLPNKYFRYVDTPINFLKGLFKNNDLKDLTNNLWYLNGKEFIDERNLDGIEPEFRIEETAIKNIKNSLIFEFLRQSLLLSNSDNFKNFTPTNYPSLNLNNSDLIIKDIEDINLKVENEANIELNKTLKYNEDKFNKTRFNPSRFLVMDVEYLHVTFPTGNDSRSFNFPCLFSSITWEGTREGLKVKINPLILPCHFCDDSCDDFKSGNLKFDCLPFAHKLIDNQVSLLEEMFAKYQNFKIFSYGNSDIFQLEQCDNFFSDSFEARSYLRRNRKRATRITKVSFDISEESKSLEDLEKCYLENWLSGWKRKNPHSNVNRRFMTKWNSRYWKIKYEESLRTCVDDTISAFLLTIYKNYKKEGVSPSTNTMSLDNWFS